MELGAPTNASNFSLFFYTYAFIFLRCALNFFNFARLIFFEVRDEWCDYRALGVVVRGRDVCAGDGLAVIFSFKEPVRLICVQYRSSRALFFSQV